MNKTILITGGVGFVGHHIVAGVLKDTDWNIVVLDNLNYAANLERLRDLDIWEKEEHRVKFVWWDLKSELDKQVIDQIGVVNYIWHLAAGSHVDRSIQYPISFLRDNTLGTVNLLEYARKVEPELFLYFSTDEVYGPAPDNKDYNEGERHNPGNPYAASKASAEDFCTAYANTYGLNIKISNTMNVYGERQHSEKFIPIIIRSLLFGKKLTIHDGSRYWIHARNVCKALIFLTNSKKFREEKLSTLDASQGRINIVGEIEKTNLELAQCVGEAVGKAFDNYDVVDSRKCRPGHDKRYGLTGNKLKKEYGFEYPLTFEESLKKTVEWYKNNKNWL